MPTTPINGVPRAVVIKLISFAFALAILPIASFFLTQDRLFAGNASYAGAFAGLVANIVLVAYVVVAFMEDGGSDLAEGSSGEKSDSRKRQTLEEKKKS